MKLFNHFDLIMILLMFSISIDHPDRGLPYDNSDCGPWSDVIRPVKEPLLERKYRQTPQGWFTSNGAHIHKTAEGAY